MGRPLMYWSFLTWRGDPGGARFQGVRSGVGLRHPWSAFRTGIAEGLERKLDWLVWKIAMSVGNLDSLTLVGVWTQTPGNCFFDGPYLTSKSPEADR